MEQKICRICLVQNVRMYSITKTSLQNVYEKLAESALANESMPVSACYICYARLKSSQQLMIMCKQSDMKFRLILNNNMINPSTIKGPIISNFKMQSVLRINIPPKSENIPHHNIKKEEGNILDQDNIPSFVKQEPKDNNNYNDYDIKEEFEELSEETWNYINSQNETDTSEFAIDNNNSHLDSMDDDDDAVYSVPEPQLDKEGPSNIKMEDNDEDVSIESIDNLEPITNEDNINENQDKLIVVNNTIRSHYRKKTNNTTNDTVYNIHLDPSWYRQIRFQKQNPISSNEIFKCDMCNFTCNHRPAFKYHMRIHADEKRYKCSVCEKGFQTPRDMYRHELLHTGEMPFECDVCQKKFREKAKLKIHYRIHTGERPYKCTECDNGFTNASNLSRHVRVHHTKEMRYQCEICQRKFNEKRSMARHRLTHDAKSLRKCQVCDYESYSNKRFKNHLCKKPSAYPYKCDKCYKRFKSAKILNKHHDTCTDIFICDICGRRFYQRGSIQAHLLSHSGLKPFICEICNKSFSQTGHLNRHILTHAKKKAYKCELCQEEFTQKVSLERHSLKFHFISFHVENKHIIN